MRFTVIISAMLLFQIKTFAQFPEKDRSKIMKTIIALPSKENGYYHDNGHFIKVPLQYSFINCFGEIHLWISEIKKEIKAHNPTNPGGGQYYYKDVLYNIADYYKKPYKYDPYLGKLKVVVSRNKGITQMSGSYAKNSALFDSKKAEYGCTNVAEMELTAVVDFDFGGCVGQTYSLVIEDKNGNGGVARTTCGYTNVELRNADFFKELEIVSIEVVEADSRDYEIESAIQAKLDEKETNKEYAAYIKKGDQLFAQKKYREAWDEYSNAQFKKNDAEYPAKKIAELDKIISKLDEKDELKEKNKEYAAYIKKADMLFAQKKYKEARNEYNNALYIKSDAAYVKQKIAQLDELIRKEELEEEFKYWVVKGDEAASNNKKTDARNAYKEALKLKPGNKTVQAKLDAIGEDKVSEYLEEAAQILSKIKISDGDRGELKCTYNLSYIGTVVTYTIFLDGSSNNSAGGGVRQYVFDLRDILKISTGIKTKINKSEIFWGSTVNDLKLEGLKNYINIWGFRVYKNEDSEVFNQFLDLIKKAATTAGAELEE